MTVASECVVAGELGLRYAAICVVDNLANGVGETALSLEQIEANREFTSGRLVAALTRALPQLACRARLNLDGTGAPNSPFWRLRTGGGVSR